MRLHIAINLSESANARLAKLCQKAEPDMPRQHELVLARIKHPDIAAAKAALDTLDFDPLDISIDRIVTGSGDNDDVFCACTAPNPALRALKDALLDSLKTAGLEPVDTNPGMRIALYGDCCAGVSEPFESITDPVSIIDLMKTECVGQKRSSVSVHRRGKWLAPLVVKPYDSAWAYEFERLKEYNEDHAGDLIEHVHHVGSTSVVGLFAKPILDVDIEIGSYDVFERLVERLASAGWRHAGDFGIADREAFKPTRPLGFMQHHLYVCPSTSRELRRHLMLRDRLREDAAARHEYGQLKLRLAQMHTNDIGAYIDGKTAFIEQQLKIAQTQKT